MGLFGEILWLSEPRTRSIKNKNQLKNICVMNQTNTGLVDQEID